MEWYYLQGEGTRTIHGVIRLGWSSLVIDAHGHAWMCAWADAATQESEFTHALPVLLFERV